MDGPGPQFDVDDFVRQHHAEQEEDQNTSDVDQDLGYSQEVGLKKHIEPGNAEEREEKRERRINDALREDDNEPGDHGDERKDEKDNIEDFHGKL